MAAGLLLCVCFVGPWPRRTHVRLAKRTVMGSYDPTDCEATFSAGIRVLQGQLKSGRGREMLQRARAARFGFAGLLRFYHCLLKSGEQQDVIGSFRTVTTPVHWF